MSQRVVFVMVDGDLLPEVFRQLPDEAEALEIVENQIAEGNIEEKETCEVDADWYEIGEGESGMDTFIPEADLLVAYDKDGVAGLERLSGEMRVDYIDSVTLEVEM